MRILKALLVLLLIPAVLTLIGDIGDSATSLESEGLLSFNAFEEFIMGLWPFLLVGMAILGIFMAIRKLSGGDKD